MMNASLVTYRTIDSHEISAACDLIENVFNRYNAPALAAEGIAEFRKYNSPEAMIKRANSHFSIVATEGRRIVGVIEIRNNRHISLLFVLPDFQKRSIARNLWTHALQRIRESELSIREFTVSSSLYAISVYERFGFLRTGPEQVANGLRFFPMALCT